MATQIRLHDNSYVNATYVPNAFFDTYMTSAPGEFVKIYLYLLRCLSGSKPFTIGMIADVFGYTEGDVRRALSYWEKVNLLSLEYDEAGNIKGIYFHYGSEPVANAAHSEADTDSTSCSKEPEAAASTDALPKRGTYSARVLSAFSKEEDIEQLIFLAESYMKRTLSSEDISMLYYWNKSLNLSADLIEYLIETCVSQKQTSMKFMEKTAIVWYNNKVTNRKAAKALSAATPDPAMKSAVMKAFGIKGRDLNQWECEFICKWTSDWHFDESLLSEACKRTIAKTHQASFEYTDSILKNWHEAKASSMAEIIALDDAYKAKLASKASKTVKPAAGAKFNNFTSRSYDYSQLEQQLVMN